MSEIESHYRSFITDRREKALYRALTPVAAEGAGRINVDGASYLNFASNDYLGLKAHPLLRQRGEEWAAAQGAGSGASRLVTGNIPAYTALEDKIALFKGKEAALVMVSGFQANSSVLPALFDKKVLGQEPLIFSDRLIHASMHAGCQAASVRQQRFHHNDMAHLERLLQKHETSDQPKFILTESVFSMDGDIAPLQDLRRLADQYNAFLIVDEAHATGVMGAQGRGLSGGADGADLIIGTFGKAFGSFGAYVACTAIVKDYLVNKCAGLIYATGLPPYVLGCIDAALDMVPDMDDERAHLHNMAQHLRGKLAEWGYDTGPSASQIIPVILGDADRTMQFSESLRQRGIYLTAIRPPTVPEGTARLRIALSVAHRHDDIEILLEGLKALASQKAA